MGVLELSRRALAWDIWANRTQLSVLKVLPEEDVARETGASHGSLLGTMAHILGSELVWLDRFLGAPAWDRVPGVEDYPDVASLEMGFQEHWTQLEFFLASLSESQLATEIQWQNTRGEEQASPLWKPLMHVVTHSAYHRGQVTSLVRQLGYEPPSTDMIYYLLSH